jgi:hypothetical protein
MMLFFVDVVDAVDGDVVDEDKILQSGRVNCLYTIVIIIAWPSARLQHGEHGQCSNPSPTLLFSRSPAKTTSATLFAASLVVSVGKHSHTNN